MPISFDSPPRRANLWLMVFALVGASLVWLYPDAEQQDSANHFLFSRWAAIHPVYFVSVWARPLFTLIYFLPSQFGYPAAKLFTVGIGLITAWQTFRLAEGLKLRRAEMIVPLLWLQPALFALSSEVMTEMLFALLFVVALRLHLAGKITAGMLVASLLILVRPEGFFIGVLWGFWILDFGFWIRRPVGREIQNPKSKIQILRCLLLASGMVVWWLAALAITGDKLWIVHNWPHDWQVDGQANGTGPIWWYAAQLPLIAGLPLFVPFLVGLWDLLRHRKLGFATSSFLMLFGMHSLMFVFGWFGSAGYARYFVCISPVIALISLVGWNELADKWSRRWLQAAGLTLAALTCLVYVDSIRFSRDAFAVKAMSDWIHLFHPELFKVSEGTHYTRLISSQVYPRVLFDRDPLENASFTANREHNLNLIRHSPEGTLVLWEDDTGPKWFRLQADDFQDAGYELLKSQEFKLQGYFVRLPWSRFGGWRLQRMHWLYKRPRSQP
ncbi:MAG: hypothetical protein SF097_01785 [Acidobacteriota bacterium]|nr:hypothetical protein [Acidobacteriota bacterium]